MTPPGSKLVEGDSPQSADISRIDLMTRSIVDVILLVNFLFICFYILQDYRSDGNAWKQGDWLINNAGGDVRRGPFGSAIIYASDTINLNPLLTVTITQIFLLLILFTSFRFLSLEVKIPSLSILALVSPAIFTIFWAADPQGSARKEIIVFAGLTIFVLALLREVWPAVWAGVVLICISFVAHEAMVLFVPTFFMVIFISGLISDRNKNIILATAVVSISALFSIYYAIENSKISDTGAICASLVERGLTAGICKGAINWLSQGSTDGLQSVASFLTTTSLIGFIIAYGAAIAPLIYIAKISTRPTRNILILLALVAPFTPLYFIAIDWGRWMSFHIFSAVIISIYAGATGKLQLSRPPPKMFIAAFVVVALILSPRHTIGMEKAGALGRVSSGAVKLIETTLTRLQTH